MNTLIKTEIPPVLPKTVGKWRAIYWEPVMMTGERLCVGFATFWESKSLAVVTIRPDVLNVLFGAAGSKSQMLLEKTIRILNSKLASSNDIENIESPISGFYFGSVEACHVNSYTELLQVGKIMSSSLSTLSEPDFPDAADNIEALSENSQPNRQFATRVKDLTIAKNISLAAYFNKEASLMTTRRTVRFGFLSNQLAAHFGLLQPTSIQKHVRMARGLIAELSLAARHSDRSGLLVMGFPPLDSATLSDKERYALTDYLEELKLESAEFKVKFAATDNDTEACEALLAEV